MNAGGGDPRRRLIDLFLRGNGWRNALYVHSPFCPSKCRYCVYASTADHSEAEREAFYRETIPRQIEEFGEVLRGVRFEEVYFGGGTPTLLDAAGMESLFDSIPGFDAIPKKGVEASPATLSAEHLDLFARHGFSYVSVGVQSLSRRILRAQGRPYAPARRLRSIAREVESRGILCNFDLICYLDGGGLDDLPGFEEELDRVMGELSPCSITIHSNYQAPASIEKTRALIDLVRRAVDRFPEYRGVNSCLDPDDAPEDTARGAEYRIMRRGHEYYNYMWSKHVSIPVPGYNVLSIGHREEQRTWSNAGLFAVDTGDYRPIRVSRDTVRRLGHDASSIRRRLGFPWPEPLDDPEGGG